MSDADLLARSPDLRLAAESGKVTPAHVNSLADYEAESDQAFGLSVERFGEMLVPAPPSTRSPFRRLHAGQR